MFYEFILLKNPGQVAGILLFSPKYRWTPNKNSLSGWMESVWEINGIVFMLMGYFDEKDCELVALGRQGVLKNYFLTQQ